MVQMKNLLKIWMSVWKWKKSNVYQVEKSGLCFLCYTLCKLQSIIPIFINHFIASVSFFANFFNANKLDIEEPLRFSWILDLIWNIFSDRCYQQVFMRQRRFLQPKNSPDKTQWEKHESFWYGKSPASSGESENKCAEELLYNWSLGTFYDVTRALWDTFATSFQRRQSRVPQWL